MSVRARLRVERGAFALDLELEANPGETVAILGPNASGKSTLLEALAGTTPIASGSVAINDTTVDEPAARIFVPPERRGVGVVFQDGALFGHLTALENVAFGLRARGTRRGPARDAARTWLERMEIADVADSLPHALSGGQRQRVALARALAPSPSVLLLDEPLSALDVRTRVEVRRTLLASLDAFAGVRILVTHDPADAHAIANRIVVIENGRVTQHGKLAEVTAHPRSEYVARLAGTNWLPALSDGAVLMTDRGTTVVAAGAVDAGPATIAIAPSAVALHATEPHGSPRNVWPVRVTDVDEFGGRVRVSLTGAIDLIAEITPSAYAELGVAPGLELWASVKATEIHAEAL